MAKRKIKTFEDANKVLDDLLSEYVQAEAAKRAPLLPDEITPRMFALRVSTGAVKMSSDSARDLLAKWERDGLWTVRTVILNGKEGLAYRPVKARKK